MLEQGAILVGKNWNLFLLFRIRVLSAGPQIIDSTSYLLVFNTESFSQILGLKLRVESKAFWLGEIELDPHSRKDPILSGKQDNISGNDLCHIMVP